MEKNAIPPKNKPPYLLGLFCVIPLIGALIGLALLLYGIYKYKDKRLIVIGSAGILWTIIAYTAIYLVGTRTSGFQNSFKESSQMQLNRLVQNLEYYNLSHGQYPDSLMQLLIDDKMAPIYDPMQGFNAKNIYYNYEKIGNKYLVFSSGVDCVPKTDDDLFPKLTIADSSKIGLINHW
ncbi:MAG: hypothetical protein IPI65_19480 [Bacteroidetes bacterium]|nr:hypothetical protein [Bacteroidota bacterium]